jgi:uncharacterized protein
MADGPGFDLRAEYTKYEYRVPMRDGVRLLTSVLVPKDDSKPYPIMLFRSPFGVGPYGPDEDIPIGRQTEALLRAGYIFVRQDVRGRLLSEGDFTHVTPHRPDKRGPSDIDESSDTWDTVEWLLAHLPNHNGRVGIYGISYVGFFTAAGIIDTHPAIKAASPQAPVADLFQGDDWFHGGAFMLAHAFNSAWSYQPQSGPTRPPLVELPFDWGTQDAYEYYLQAGTLSELTGRVPGNPTWQELMDHSSYDEFWQARAIWRHLSNIHCPVLVVGGWFDAEDLSGPFRVYHAIREKNPGVPTTLVVGPWTHGGWSNTDGRRLGSIDFATDTAEFYREHVLVPFFEHYLKDGPDPRLPGALVFETGTNVWRRYAEWPSPDTEARTLYFRDRGELRLDPPSEADASDTFVSDPSKPVPWLAYTALTMPEEYMVSDQRFAATRPDVLVYATEPLDEDLTVAGPITARLFVSTSGTDADWVVKLIDVFPPDRSTPEGSAAPGSWSPPVTLAGYQQLVRGWPLRGKFRKSFETPEPFEPGRVEAIEIDAPDVNHVFRRGHRVMVQVQSTWFPLIDRNPQTFVDIPHAKPEDFTAATHRIMRSSAQPSGIEVSVLRAP